MNDFLQGCNEQGMKDAEFQQIFCEHCRNHECFRAKWADSLFTRRVMTQEERLLSPRQADPTLSKYEPLQRAEFKDMLEQAIRLEIADRRGDWTVPEIGATLDIRETPEQIIERSVRAAMQFQPKEEGDVPTDEVDPPIEEASANPFAVAPEQETGTPAVVTPPPKVSMPRAHNTSVPVGGIMLGGATKPPAPPKGSEVDPWAPPVAPPAKKVPVGGTVRMGGK